MVDIILAIFLYLNVLSLLYKYSNV